ncbi:MAG: NTP transferase domain-containing protein, partial [Desulfobacterales bacterium]
MKAIIYAAGRSLRLGAEFAGQQKILMPFGGKSLLEWHVQRLCTVGVRTLCVVTGYRRQKIRHVIEDLRREYPIAITELVNTHFEEGSVISVYTSLPQIQKA